VFASNTRVLTMGDNHVILTDDANIWNWASRLNDYPGLAIAEFGYNSSYMYQFGVHWQFGDDNPWILATYFDNAFNYFPYWGLPFSPLSENRRANIFYARMLGANKFGARTSLYWSGQEYTDNDPDQFNNSFWYYEFHVSLTANDNSWDLSATGGFGSWTNEVDGIPLSEPDGLIDFAVLGRMFWESGPNYRYVPHAMVEYHKGGFDYFDAAGANDQSYNLTNVTFDIGIGQVYTPSNNVEAVLDLGIAFERNKEEYTEVIVAGNDDSYEDKWSYTTIPYFRLGLDAEVFTWMDVRLGATSFWQRYKDEFSQPALPTPYTQEDKQNYAENDTYLGFGFHWGNLHVDTYTDPYLFLQGFNFVSGNDNGNMNFQISAVYDLM
jgi:hypothetical protein